MSQSADLPPPRRPLFLPVAIATVLLSIIGMSAGLALGSRYDRPQRTGDQSSEIPTNRGGSPVGCPAEMHVTARRLGYELPMTQLLRVRVQDTGMTVWICQDTAGKLYYQANQGGEGATWIEGKTALFLSDVVARDGGYLATAVDGNTFDVNGERLEVVVKGRKRTSAVTPE